MASEAGAEPTVAGRAGGPDDRPPLTWRDVRRDTRRRADELVCTEAEAVALEALRTATGETDGHMERHTVRQYLIAERLADTRGLAYDREVLLCASFLHDAGLYGPASSGDVYIKDSARYARRTLEPLGWPEERLRVCIDACEQHHALTSRWWMPNEVELVRRSDLVEVLPELVRFGIPRSWLKRALWQAVPRAGFWPATFDILRSHWRRLPGMFMPPTPGSSAAGLPMTPNTPARVGTLAWAERSGGILSRRERIGLLGDAARLQMRILPAQTRALLGRTNSRAFSVDPDRLRIPDTMIAREAEALCSEVSEQALLNHCLRSYAWGTILAERDGLEHDSELFYVTCLLHDLGVTDRYRDTVAGQSCFAATAATIARDWSHERGWREPPCTALADAICQHINPEVRPEHGIEAHLMQAGAGFDVVGIRHWEVATPTVQTVLARHPRLGFKKSFGSAMCAQADQHHGTRTHFLFRYMQFGARINRAPYDD